MRCGPLRRAPGTNAASSCPALGQPGQLHRHHAFDAAQLLRPGQHLRARQRRVAIDVDDVVVLRARTQGDAPDRQARVAGGILHPCQRRIRRDAQAQPAAVCATVQVTLFQRLEQCQDRPHQQRRHDRRRIKAGARGQANRRHRPQSSGGGRPADHLFALQEQEGAGTGEAHAAGHLRGDAQWIERDARPPRHGEDAERGHDHRQRRAHADAHVRAQSGGPFQAPAVDADHRAGQGRQQQPQAKFPPLDHRRLPTASRSPAGSLPTPQCRPMRRPRGHGWRVPRAGTAHHGVTLQGSPHRNLRCTAMTPPCW